LQYNFGGEEEEDEWGRLEAVVEERTEAASQILSTQLTRDKIDSDILRTARPIGKRSMDPHLWECESGSRSKEIDQN
jgi:hypothetical protein